MALPASLNEVASAEPGDLILIDVRKNPDEAQIPGSVRHDGSRIEQAEHLPFSEGDRVVLYCGSGNSSSRIAQTLQDRGFANVRALQGGYAAWKEAGLPTEPLTP